MQGPGDCIYEDTLYRFIVRGSYGHGGNLQVDNGFLIIVPEFEEATPLYFYPSASGGVRIGQRTPSGPLVMATVESGESLSFEQPKSGLDRQVFDLQPRINDINKKSGRKLVLWTSFSHPLFSQIYQAFSFENNNNRILARMCLPGTDIKVFEPFLIRNHALESFISWSRRGPVVVGGKAGGGGGLQPLHVSVVPLDKGELATEEIPDDCILEDVDYLFKINAPFAGYLRATKQYLTIVGNAKDASRLYLHKSAGQGLRIALHSPDGALVVATTEPSRPLVFERPESKNERQVFDLVPLNSNEKMK